MRHGSLFSGIGGFDLAAEWMGWENVFHCEWMEFPRKVLDYHFPNADSHIDICKTDFKKYANTIDILTGGFPCQPFSLAGKRKGTDDERYLWGEMLRAIQEIKPRFVIAENVAGITSIDGGLVFEQVCLDLEAEGYEVQPFIIPAAAKNAPHRRDRCWFIATNTNCNDGRSTDRKGGCEESKANGEGQQSIHSRIGTTSNEGNATNANGRGTQTRQVGKVLGQSDTQEETGGFVNDALQRNASYSNSNGLNKRNGNDEINTSEGGEYALGHIGESNDNGNTSNTKCQGLFGNNNTGQKNNLYRENTKLWRGTTGYNKKNDWNKFPTQSPVCGGDDGLPSELDGITFSKWRAESIKGYGNAIVPQIAHQLFQILETL
jgi:DNA (cytosine-5)-methyltransferase 1